MVGKFIDLYGFAPSGVTGGSYCILQPGYDIGFSGDNWRILIDVPTDGVIFHTSVDITPDFRSHSTGNFFLAVDGEFWRSCQIDPITGDETESNISNMLTQQQLQYCSDSIVSFGFYRAGVGYDDVIYTSRYQAYIYSGDLLRPLWMGTLVQQHQALGNMPFSTFVLPGGHDVGMNTKKHIDVIAEDPAAIRAIVTGLSGSTIAGALGAIVDDLDPSEVARILVDLGITQKDNITDMLNMGIRYFDFRPGYCAKINGTKVLSGDALFHQHNVIPGMRFEDFLNDVVSWLSKHTEEIVVVSLGFAGFFDDSMKPVADTLKAMIRSALNGTSIITGSISDASKNYNDLISENRRLLFFNNGVGFNNAEKSDSYSDKAYSTLLVEPIIAALNDMPTKPPVEDSYTVLQFQGTASAVDALWPSLAMFGTNDTSPLLMTKAKFDQKTYTWARANLGNFSPSAPVVILNDFVDPVMSHIAQEATLVRAGLKE